MINFFFLLWTKELDWEVPKMLQLFLEGCQIMVLFLKKKKNMLKLYACIIELNYSGGVSCSRILTSLFDQSDVVKYPIPTDYNGHDIETWNLYL